MSDKGGFNPIIYGILAMAFFAALVWHSTTSHVDDLEKRQKALEAKMKADSSASALRDSTIIVAKRSAGDSLR